MDDDFVFLESRLLALELLIINSEELKSKYISIFENVKNQLLNSESDLLDSQIQVNKIEQHLSVIRRIELPKP